VSARTAIVCAPCRSDGATGTRFSQQYCPKDLRLGARDEVNAIVAKWVATLDLKSVLARCAEGGVPASLIYSIAGIFDDPQCRERGNIKLTESRARAIAVPDVVPGLFATPRPAKSAGSVKDRRAERGNHPRSARPERDGAGAYAR
jgi:crotonobetainyl-CoA:carnitine CoA-transferase CaiB-like acyl-CoA transferase